MAESERLTTVPRWQGEMLWPQSLPELTAVDMSAVTAIGSWLHGWLRARPGLALIGLSAPLREQLRLAAVPVLHYRSVDEALASGIMPGVSPAERDMLLQAALEPDAKVDDDIAAAQDSSHPPASWGGR